MPTFALFTNLQKSQIPDNFLEETSKFVAKILKKPESVYHIISYNGILRYYVTIRVHPDQLMCHGGSTEPCASIEMHSIGNIGPAVNKQLAKDIADYIEQKLAIKADRFYIRFWDIPRPELGYNGSTFG